MNPTTLATLFIVLAYLIGSIPFAYVVVKAVQGVDIRTVGSGNVGATNAGRLLGLRYFVLVFFLDMLKGLVPTVAFPLLVRAMTGRGVMDLPVMIALSTIIGHNFPIYLNFQGGKGVSTSLGAAFGLDWAASFGATIVFFVALRACGYVSLSSVLGAAAFVIVYFVHLLVLRKSPWDREHVALTVLILGLMLMLVIRHRKNWARIREGTEPRVGRRFKRPASGCAKVWLVVAIGILAIGSLLLLRVARPQALDCGDFTLTDLGRVQTGHQRADRLVFADSGKRLGVLCPRYNRLMIYRVTENPSLELAHDVELEGQPVAIRTFGDRFYLLLRPSGDLRHIHKGFLQPLDLEGRPIGAKIEVGFYPTDFAVNGSMAYVLTAGRAEGAAEMPPPAMVTIDLTSGKTTGAMAFDSPGDDPSRIVLSSSGQCAAVTLRGSNTVAAMDLTTPSSPTLMSRSPLPPRLIPYPSITSQDWILMPVRSDREAAVFSIPGLSLGTTPLQDFLVSTMPEESAIEVQKVASSAAIGRLPLRGSAHVGLIKPTALAVSSERGLIAVANRSGGVNLVAIEAGKTTRK